MVKCQTKNVKVTEHSVQSNREYSRLLSQVWLLASWDNVIPRWCQRLCSDPVRSAC